MSVTQADNTLVSIRKKVRRLTASASESSLSTSDLDSYINLYYSTDFPYAVKIDQLRSVYTFFTSPNVDRYPLDVNYNQGVRAPVYVSGIPGIFFKDRDQFFNLYPRFPFMQNITYAPLTGAITNVTAALPAVVTSANHGLQTGTVIYISDVVGSTGVNGGPFVITVTGTNTFSLNGVTAGGAYVSGGTWTSTIVNFNIPGPFLSREVVIGGTDVSGNAVSVNDDGNGNLLLQVPNPVVSVPQQSSVYNSDPPLANTINGAPIPGMYNRNTQNPGLNNTSAVTPPFTNAIGSVDYVNGNFSINFPVALDPSIQMTVWVTQYQTGRPYALLFWNNEFTVRPVPDLIHKMEVETYLTPVQFLQTTDRPILDQWSQLIAIGAALKVLEDRQDMEGVSNLIELYQRQEALALERQAIEEINQPNITLFNSTTQTMGLGASSLGYW